MTDLHDAPTAPPRPRGPGRAEAQGERPRSSIGLFVLGALLVLAGATRGWSLLAMIGALVVMIFLHELGHYLTAKWAGMKVTEFFIGFGPRIWSFRRGETEYGIKAIPAGAYVKIIGMHNLDEYDPADADRTYLSKPYWRRLSVAVAGSTMHFLLALLCLVVAYAGVGVPLGRVLADQADADAYVEAEYAGPWTVGLVSLDSAAADIGVRTGDRILGIDGIDTPSFQSFIDAVSARPGETVDVVLERSGETRTVPVTLASRSDDGEARGFFGVGPDFPALPSERVGLGTAVSRAGGDFVASLGATWDGLTTILSPSGIADVARLAFGGSDTTDDAVPSGSGGGGSTESSARPTGIVGIADFGAGLLHDGQFGLWLSVFAVVNIFIGVFNLVPLLPLDGGHVAIATYEKIRSMLRGGRPYHVDVVKLLPLTYGVVLVLAFLGISTLVLDVRGT